MCNILHRFYFIIITGGGCVFCETTVTAVITTSTTTTTATTLRIYLENVYCIFHIHHCRSSLLLLFHTFFYFYYISVAVYEFFQICTYVYTICIMCVKRICFLLCIKVCIWFLCVVLSFYRIGVLTFSFFIHAAKNEKKKDGGRHFL